MKLLVVLCIVGAAMAAVLPNRYSGQDAQLSRYESENSGLGNYRFAFEQTDGTRREEQGQLKNEGRPDESIVVRGSFSYISPEGIRVTVIYISDENGFQPEIQEGPGGVSPGFMATAMG